MESGNDDAPVLIKQQQAQEAVKAVFRCGRCSDQCPAYLVPSSVICTQCIGALSMENTCATLAKHQQL